MAVLLPRARLARDFFEMIVVSKEKRIQLLIQAENVCA